MTTGRKGEMREKSREKKESNLGRETVTGRKKNLEIEIEIVTEKVTDLVIGEATDMVIIEMGEVIMRGRGTEIIGVEIEADLTLQSDVTAGEVQFVIVAREIDVVFSDHQIEEVFHGSSFNYLLSLVTFIYERV